MSVHRQDRRLLRRLDEEFADAAARAGHWLACAPGCSDCCIGPFPITRLDVWRLRRGLARLAARDPSRAAALRARAERAGAELTPDYPGRPGTGRLAADESALDRFFARHRRLACPVLDPAGGRCELYEHRPVSCRTYGPPLRFGEVSSPPCTLCFVGADEAAVERCRYTPDHQDLEARALARLGVAAGEDWETLVAFAVARDD